MLYCLEKVLHVNHLPLISIPMMDDDFMTLVRDRKWCVSSLMLALGASQDIDQRPCWIIDSHKTM